MKKYCLSVNDWLLFFCVHIHVVSFIFPAKRVAHQIPEEILNDERLKSAVNQVRLFFTFTNLVGMLCN